MKKSIVVLFLFVFSLSFSFTAVNIADNNSTKAKAETKCPYLQSHPGSSGITCPYLREKMSQDHGTIQDGKLDDMPKCPYIEKNKNDKGDGIKYSPVIELKSV